MRLLCYGCNKSVSTEVPEETIIRAVMWCPECIERLAADGRLNLDAPPPEVFGTRSYD
jgi:hypothetical protein